MLRLQQRVYLPQGGDREALLLLLHLQPLQRHNLAGLLVTGPVHHTERALLNPVEAVKLLHAATTLPPTDQCARRSGRSDGACCNTPSKRRLAVTCVDQRRLAAARSLRNRRALRNRLEASLTHPWSTMESSQPAPSRGVSC